MNKEISLVIWRLLKDLPYIEKSTGIVQVVEKPVNLQSETVYKKIPVSTLANAKECGANDLSAIEMIPDGKLKGLFYFEDNGISQGVRRSSSQQWISNLRLVCWLNTRLITGVDDMLLTSKVMNEMIQILTKKIINSSPFVNISCVINRVPIADAQLFSKYDYDEKRTQYLLSPYDFFALDLTVNFDLPFSCRPEIPITPEPPKC